MKNTLEIPRIKNDHIEAGMKAAINIMKAWGMTNDEMRVMLGHLARPTFYKWKRGDIGYVPHDTVTRISYILGIYKSLQILFPSPDRADQWINRPNKAFGGQSAKDRMLAGEITDLALIRQHLDAARGAW